MHVNRVYSSLFSLWTAVHLRVSENILLNVTILSEQFACICILDTSLLSMEAIS